MKQIKPKSLVLLSGGLDSRLASKIMQEQTEVTALHIKIPFSKNNDKELKEFCKKEKIKLKIIKIQGKLLQDYLNILKHPKYGRGSAYNPCIDCHIFMLKLAKNYADKNKIEIIATGEVLGERPMSQHKKALEIVEKESGLKGRLIRPLISKYNIQGRSRKKQIELANQFKISYPSPAGGCLLCEKDFSERIKDLLKNIDIKKIKSEDIEILKLGRHFQGKGKIILGRNKQENLEIEKLNKKMKYNIIIPEEIPGPTAIYENKEDKILAESLIKAYSKGNLEERKKFEKYRL